MPCTCVHTCMCMHMWRSANNFGESVLSFCLAEAGSLLFLPCCCSRLAGPPGSGQFSGLCLHLPGIADMCLHVQPFMSVPGMCQALLSTRLSHWPLFENTCQSITKRMTASTILVSGSCGQALAGAFICITFFHLHIST